MIDLHCHILPGIDDGPADEAGTLAMARRACADGIRIIAATPHTLNGVFHNRFDQVRAQVKHFNTVLETEGIDLRLCSGIEAHMCMGMADRLRCGEIGTLNNSGRYLLIEFPFQAMPSGYRNELFQLRIKGITPIIAHPERNVIVQNEPEIAYELVEMGCLLQLTAMSITGELGEEAMICAHRLLELRLAHVVATDSHSVENRPPVMSEAVSAITQLLGEPETAREMTMTRPKAILHGTPLSIPEPLRPVKKRWFSRLMELAIG